MTIYHWQNDWQNIPHLVLCDFTLARVAGRSPVVSVSKWILKDSGWGLLSSIPRCLAPPLILDKDWDYLSWLEHDADNTKVVSLIPEGAIHLQAGLENVFLVIFCESVLSLYSSMQDEKNSIRTLLHISSGEEKGSCCKMDFLPAKCLEIPAWM